MIIKLSVLGTMETGKTKTASVSNKGREFNNTDSKRLSSLEMVHINANMQNFYTVIRGIYFGRCFCFEQF